MDAENRRELADRGMEEAGAAKEPRPFPSVESSLQLREALLTLNRTEVQFYTCDVLSALPPLARDYAEACERVRAALGVVCSEGGIPDIPTLHEMRAVLRRG